MGRDYSDMPLSELGNHIAELRALWERREREERGIEWSQENFAGTAKLIGKLQDMGDSIWTLLFEDGKAFLRRGDSVCVPSRNQASGIIEILQRYVDRNWSTEVPIEHVPAKVEGVQKSEVLDTEGNVLMTVTSRDPGLFAPQSARVTVKDGEARFELAQPSNNFAVIADQVRLTELEAEVERLQGALLRKEEIIEGARESWRKEVQRLRGEDPSGDPPF